MFRFEIHGENLTITDAIRNYIEDKIGKLERYFNNVPNAIAHVKVNFLLGLLSSLLKQI